MNVTGHLSRMRRCDKCNKPCLDKELLEILSDEFDGTPQPTGEIICISCWNKIPNVQHVQEDRS